MTDNQLILSPFEKALESLNNALAQPKDEFVRDAVIQRFEYTYELAWKMLKRYLATQAGIEEKNIKNVFRAGARLNLVENLEDWFSYHTARNLTSQTYNVKAAEETYSVAKKFAKDAEILLKNLIDEQNNAAD